MTKRNSLVKSEMLTALKEAGVATKEDVRQIIGEEITKRGLATKDDVRHIVGEELVKRGVATKIDVEKSERRLKRFVRAEIRSVRADVAKLAIDTPTRTEFNKLKERVNRFFPAS